MQSTSGIRKIIIPFLVTGTIIIVMFLVFNDLEGTFTQMLEQFAQKPAQYALVSLLVLASDIVLPVPSSIVMFTNGYVLGVWSGSALSLAALMIGVVLGYFIGSLSGGKAPSESDNTAEKILSKYGPIAILVSRGIPIVAESICIVCGYNKMPFTQYFILNLLGYIPLCLLYSLCGSLGYEKNTFLLSIGCSLAISFVFWILGKKYFKLSTK